MSGDRCASATRGRLYGGGVVVRCSAASRSILSAFYHVLWFVLCYFRVCGWWLGVIWLFYLAVLVPGVGGCLLHGG